ncbi:serine/threonine-protein kinase [Streptomyces sp. MUM 2J]|uniref:serine/threonine-protein kinase n=1 Tax=Streptomyces sp. MUM 2J TaxID=2791987 RepID=UPI001F0417A0|nr:serine/threonine-protein kinase [Streptomyces sp. MUM 2J]MCH0562096.1 serine/threonine protein kinase [Streptomyces sp. MUM 2J]
MSEFIGATLKDQAASEHHAGYRLERLLGHGGQATVFLAKDLDPATTDEVVAAKIFFGMQQTFEKQLFAKEAHRAVRLRHPNILGTYSYGQHGVMERNGGEGIRVRAPYMIAEYANGGSCADLARVAPRRAVELAEQISAGVAAAHMRGVVHLDLKPPNVLLHDGQVKVADFGISRSLHTHMSTHPVIGTPPFMAPEQWQGGKRVSDRTDTYATAVMTYLFLTGAFPYAASTATEYLNAHCFEPPIPLPDLGLPSDVATPELLALWPAIAEGLAKDPEERPAISGLSSLLRQAFEEAAARQRDAAPQYIDLGSGVAGPQNPEAEADIHSLPTAVAPGRNARAEKDGAFSRVRALLRRRISVVSGAVVVAAVASGVAYGAFHGGSSSRTPAPPSSVPHSSHRPDAAPVADASESTSASAAITPSSVTAPGTVSDGPSNCPSGDTRVNLMPGVEHPVYGCSPPESPTPTPTPSENPSSSFSCSVSPTRTTYCTWR